MATTSLFNLHHAQSFPAAQAPHFGAQPDLSPVCRVQYPVAEVAFLPATPGDFTPRRVYPYGTVGTNGTNGLMEVSPIAKAPSRGPVGFDGVLKGVEGPPAPPAPTAPPAPLGWQLSREAAAYVQQRQQMLQRLRGESLFAYRIPDAFRARASESPVAKRAGIPAVSKGLKACDDCDDQPWFDVKSLASTWQSLMTSMDALSGKWCMHDDAAGQCRFPQLKSMSSSAGFDEPWFARTAPTISPDTPGGQASPFLAARAPLVKVDADEVSQVHSNLAQQQGNVQQPLSQPQTKEVLQRHDSFVVSIKGNKATAPNQDRASVVNFGNVELLTLCDGHGEVGHDVAELCCEVLPKLLLATVAGLEGGISRGVRNKEAKDPKEAAAALNDLWGKAAIQTYIEMHRLTEALTVLSLDQEAGKPLFDARCSGTTATSIVLSNERIFVAHVGDSRAVLGIRPLGGQWMVRELTRDHKPELPEERIRIEQNGAQVITVGQPPNATCRVYNHQQAWPSINMSRSLGDLHAHSQGLSSEAEVNLIEPSWETSAQTVLIVASDGLWDVIDSFSVVPMAFEAFQTGADPAHVLSQEAYARWGRRGLQGGYSDDISIIVRIL